MLQALIDRWDRAQEWRRQIDRENENFDPGKLVLIDEFFEYAVKPAMDSSNHFKNAFHDVVVLKGTMDWLVREWQVSKIPVSYKKLDYKMQRFFDLLQKPFHQELRKEAQRARAGEISLFELEQKRQQLYQDGLYSRMNGGEEGAQFPAMYLRDIAFALHVQQRNLIKEPNAIDVFELSCLWSDRGDVALKFWQDMNKLRDYSNPKRPKPRGNNDNREPEESKEWKPAFVPI